MAAEVMEPVETYHLIVGLVFANDWDIFDQVVREHPSEFPPTSLDIYREIGDTIVRLLDQYDFTKSVAFHASVEGRSERYIRAKGQLESEPVKRRKHLERLISALNELFISDEAFALVAPDQQAVLTRIRGLLNEAREK